MEEYKFFNLNVYATDSDSLDGRRLVAELYFYDKNNLWIQDENPESQTEQPTKDKCIFELREISRADIPENYTADDYLMK